MREVQQQKSKNSCFNCLWEPVWHQSGEGFEGACRCPGCKGIQILFRDDKLRYAHGKGDTVAEACQQWSSAVR